MEQKGNETAMVHGGDVYDKRIRQDFSVNLNPLPMPEALKEVYKTCLTQVECYPDPLQRKVRKALAELEGISMEQVWCGNGASELIMGLLRARKPKKVLLVTPGFYGYEHCIRSISGEVVEFPLSQRDDFRLTAQVLDVLEDTLDMVILTNPHNPTGQNIEKDLLMEILEYCQTKGIDLVVDECFLRMSTGNSISMVPYISQYPHLMVVNAMTKLFRIPGIRSGYLVAQEDVIASVMQQLPEWNMSVIAQEMTTKCAELLRTTDFIDRTTGLIQTEEAYLRTALTHLGYIVFSTDTSFLLVYGMDRKVRDALEMQGFLLRDCSNFKGLSDGFVRIAVKSHDANEALIQCLRKELA